MRSDSAAAAARPLPIVEMASRDARQGHRTVIGQAWRERGCHPYVVLPQFASDISSAGPAGLFRPSLWCPHTAASPWTLLFLCLHPAEVVQVRFYTTLFPESLCTLALRH